MLKVERIGWCIYVDVAYEEYCATRGETGVSIGQVTELTPPLQVSKLHNNKKGSYENGSTSAK